MKNKGFTLVELMAVIILLAIVTTIAYSSYRSVNTNIRKQQFENKISLIETKAAEYANDTKIMITNVDTLVKKGYLAADTEDDKVLSPIDNSSMNCYVFAMYKSEDNYYGEYLEKEECDASKLDTVNGNIIINKYVSVGGVKNEEEPLEKNDWTKEDVWLEIQSNNSDINLNEISSVKWISQLGEETNNSTTKIVSASYLIDTTYTVEITMNNGNKYRAETLVRIDKARPSITKVEIENENDWTNKEKKVTVSAHDEGSGIYGYAITNQYDCTLASYDEYNSEIYEKELSNGTYYICVKDNVGNVSNSGYAIEIKNVDLTPPVCKINYSGNMGSNGWYISNVDFYIYASDDNGIREKYIFTNGKETEHDSFTLNYDTSSYSVELKVTDLAGNVCSDSINLKRDATKPSCTSSGDNTIWTRYPVTIYYGCDDNLSGCITLTGSKTYGTSTRTDVIDGYTVVDYAGNTTVCPARTASVYIDDCTSTYQDRISTGSCSKSCGGGTRSYTYNNVGSFSRAFVCSTGSGTESCNTQACSSDSGGGGGECTYGYGCCGDDGNCKCNCAPTGNHYNCCG